MIFIEKKKTIYLLLIIKKRAEVINLNFVGHEEALNLIIITIPRGVVI